MPLTFRAGKKEDAPDCARICYDAFSSLNARHDFPSDFSSPEVAAGLMEFVLSRDDVFSVVAEQDGKVVGSNFLWENGPIAGVGPITVDGEAQNAAIGRQLMERVLERAREKKFAGVRLVQAAFHNRSLSLYTKLGFNVREPLSCMQGTPPPVKIPGRAVRPAPKVDIEASASLCTKIHGHDRSAELMGGIFKKTARVVEHAGEICGYCSELGFFGHAVGRSNDDLKALIGAGEPIAGAGFLLPSRNGELFRWCLGNGLRVVQPMTLMSLGLYNEPAGPFIASILY